MKLPVKNTTIQLESGFSDPIFTYSITTATFSVYLARLLAARFSQKSIYG